MKITKLHKAVNEILQVKDKYSNSKWQAWADNWLTGVDRSKQSARTAYEIVENDYYNHSDNQPTFLPFFYNESKHKIHQEYSSVLISTMYATKRAIKCADKMTLSEFKEADKWVNK